MTPTIHTVAAAYAALDLRAENERLTQVEAERDKSQSAMEAAEARCTEISRTIAEWTGPDSVAVADALISGSVAEAVRLGPNIAAMEAERATLRSAIKELRDRVEDGFARTKQTRTAAKSQAAPIADPLIEELTKEAHKAAKTLIDIFASAEAIFRRTDSAAARALWNSLELPVANLFEGYGLLTHNRKNMLPVPVPVTEMLRNLDGKGEVIKGAALSEVERPRPERATIVLQH